MLIITFHDIKILFAIEFKLTLPNSKYNFKTKQFLLFQSLERKDCTNSVIHEMIMHKLRQRIEVLQENVIKEVDSKLDVFVDELVNELNRFDIQNNELALLFKEQNGNHNNSVNR